MTDHVRRIDFRFRQHRYRIARQGITQARHIIFSATFFAIGEEDSRLSPEALQVPFPAPAIPNPEEPPNQYGENDNRQNYRERGHLATGFRARSRFAIA